MNLLFIAQLLWFFLLSYIYSFFIIFSSVLTIILLSLPPVSKFCKTSKVSVNVIPYNPSHLPECYTLGRFSSSESQCYDLGHTQYTSSLYLLRMSMCVSVVCGCVHIFLVYLSLWARSIWSSFPSVTAQYYIFNLVVHGTIYWGKKIYGSHYFFFTLFWVRLCSQIRTGRLEFVPINPYSYISQKISLVTNVGHLCVSLIFCTPLVLNKNWMK